MYYYRAYNLQINSEIYLPELITTSEQLPDVVITLGKIDCPKLKQHQPGYYSQIASSQAYLAWDEVGTFLVRRNEIIIEPAPKVEENLIRMALLGAIFSILLYQRDIFPLHASAVAIDEEAVVFMADKGMGKSTLAATLYERGHQLIADDLVAIDVSKPDCPLVLPGFPRLKLLPESVISVLGKDPSVFPTIADGYEKRACQVRERFVGRSIPLRGIYQLAKGSDVKVQQFQPQEALINLISNSYVSGIIHGLRKTDRAKLHFLQVTRIIESVPVYKLERPRSLELLPKIARTVESNSNSNRKSIEV